MTLRIFTVVACSLAWFVLVSPAAADCQPAGPIEEELPDAPIAFVGTVSALDGPVATFTVSEVWRGEVAQVVTVRGLFDGIGRPDGGFGAGFSEDDRQWTAGATYLVVPWIDGGVLRDSGCTATTKWSAELEQLRPDDARIFAGAGTTEAEPMPVALILVAAVAVVVAAGSALAFRRR